LSNLETGLESGADKFKALFPNIDWRHQLDYAEDIGLGSKTYELIRL
jgi:uncharacterized Fe-S center protein